MTTATVARAESSLVKFHAPEVVFGPSSLAEAGHTAARLGARRPFVVTDPGLIEAGWVAELLGHLRAVGLLRPEPEQACHGPFPRDGAPDGSLRRAR